MKDERGQRERIAVTIHATAEAACRETADVIESMVRERAQSGRSLVLGLATGSTPVKLYRELIRRHREAGRIPRNWGQPSRKLSPFHAGTVV
jgi:glucosamine-6-phosphate deaminase